MNFGWNIETYISLAGITISIIGSIFILRVNWKQYGVLYLISAVVAELLCYFFHKVGLYSYPYRFFPHILPMPFTLVVTLFPFYVLAGVRYSPKLWWWKIPFYWVLVHIGVFGEVLVQNYTQVIKYDKFWNTWDSYTWWWLFLLIFEYVGGLLISDEYRKPIDENILRYGKLGWFVIHLILISTIFLAGFYMGIKTIK